MLDMPEMRVYEVATFYTMFNRYLFMYPVANVSHEHLSCLKFMYISVSYAK